MGSEDTVIVIDEEEDDDVEIVESIVPLESNIGDMDGASEMRSVKTFLDKRIKSIIHETTDQQTQDTNNKSTSNVSNISIQNKKPPLMMRDMIMSLFATKNSNVLSMSEICSLLSETYPYYKPGGAWQGLVKILLKTDPNFETISKGGSNSYVYRVKRSHSFHTSTDSASDNAENEMSSLPKRTSNHLPSGEAKQILSQAPNSSLPPVKTFDVSSIASESFKTLRVQGPQSSSRESKSVQNNDKCSVKTLMATQSCLSSNQLTKQIQKASIENSSSSQSNSPKSDSYLPMIERRKNNWEESLDNIINNLSALEKVSSTNSQNSSNPVGATQSLNKLVYNTKLLSDKIGKREVTATLGKVLQLKDVSLMTIDDGKQPLTHDENASSSDLSDIEQPKSQKVPREGLPVCVNGYTKPTINYSKLISKALIKCPRRHGTARRICSLIAQDSPYFQHCPNIWQNSIQSALTKRKKLFQFAGMNESNEAVWTFNPQYESLILSKLLPNLVTKYFPLPVGNKKRQPSSPAIPSQKTQQRSSSAKASSESMSTTTPVIVSCESLRPDSPIFVSSGKTEFNCEELIPETNLEDESTPPEPEHALEDPEEQTAPENIQQSPAPWEPEVTVSVNETGPPQGMYKQNSRLLNYDFLLENLKIKTIENVEIKYRLDFNKEHPNVEKFRLHCTVCDAHLGTSGVMAKTKVRFHSSLGVLVCAYCYYASTEPPLNACQWCGKQHAEMITCLYCSKSFCQDCLKRNFGKQWFQQVFQVARTICSWKCCLCDPKQIWPHRAIAYFLYRFYKDLKRKASLHLPHKYSALFKMDLSNCCHYRRSRQIPTTTLHHQSTIVLDNQSPNQIHLPPAVSSVTLNTGTQYIHNVYPDKNYVVVQSPFDEELAARARQSAHGVSPSDCVQNVTFTHQVVPDVESLRSQPATKEPLNKSNLKSPAWVKSPSTPNFRYHQTKEVDQSPITENISSVVDSPVDLENGTRNPEIVDKLPESHLSDERSHRNTQSSQALSLRERIEMRPMPRSKKMSLLRSVLINKSIESMRKHFETTQADSGIEKLIADKLCTEPSKDHSDLNVAPEIAFCEEVPLSDENPVSEPSSDPLTESNDVVNDDSHSTDTTNNAVSSKIQDHLNTTPKIKIRTLQELQNNVDLDNPERNVKDISETIITDVVPNIRNVDSEVKKGNTVGEVNVPGTVADVNVSALKEGIVDSCRSLLIAQKKFKELALFISSNLMYKTSEAREVVSKFQDILSVCLNQLHAVDKNVKREFCNLVPNCNIDTLLQPLKDVPIEASEGTTLLKKKRTKRMNSEIYRENNKIKNTSSLSENLFQGMDTIPRRMVGQEEGDLPEESSYLLTAPYRLVEQLPDSVSNPDPVLMNYQMRKKAKRCIWDDKRRKRAQIKRHFARKYKKDGTLMRNSRRRRKSKEDYDDIDELDSSAPPDLHNSDSDHRLRKRTKTLIPPLRLSARRHPSSEEYIAHLLSSPDSHKHHLAHYNIRNCSVLLHRLDPRIVELLQMRAAKVL